MSSVIAFVLYATLVTVHALMAAPRLALLSVVFDVFVFVVMVLVGRWMLEDDGDNE